MGSSLVPELLAEFPCFATSRWARCPSRPAPRCGGSFERQREHQRVLAAFGRGVVGAAHRDLAEAEARIKRLRAAVARPHLEAQAARAEATRAARRLAQPQ